MFRHLRPFLLPLLIALIALPPVGAEDASPKGQRVFTCGHSFHVFISDILVELAKGAAIEDHKKSGMHFIGGSRVILHWEAAETKNKAKEQLGKGEVDVLTLSPVLLPDDGIEQFTTFALKHNPNVRVTVQQNWLPYDTYDTLIPLFPRPTDHNAPTVEKLKKMHQTYFDSIDKHVRDLNKNAGKDAVFVVPVGQAVIALREKAIAGQAPGIKKQGDLFLDAIGHPKPALAVLNAYCHYAVIYQRSPIGLPVPATLAKAKYADEEKLNRLLQEIAWDAVSNHPLTGVKK